MSCDVGEHDVSVYTAARATSAIPLFFAEFKLGMWKYNDESNSLSVIIGNETLIDGGIRANNPSLIGVLEAATLYPDCSVSCIVSIGTGMLVDSPTSSLCSSYCALSPALELSTNVLTDLTSTEEAHQQLQKLLQLSAFNKTVYLRLNITLQKAVALSDWQQMPHLKQQVQQDEYLASQITRWVPFTT